MDTKICIQISFLLIFVVIYYLRGYCRELSIFLRKTESSNYKVHQPKPMVKNLNVSQHKPVINNIEVTHYKLVNKNFINTTKNIDNISYSMHQNISNRKVQKVN